MADDSQSPPLSRRVPGAARTGPGPAPRRVFPDALLQRMQAAVDAAQASREAATQDAEAAMALLQGAGIAAGVALNGADLAIDPQLAARGFFAPGKLPDNRSTRITGVPMRLSATPGSIRTVAPEVGEDNDYILGELLGLGRAERAELIAEGVVWG